MNNVGNNEDAQKDKESQSERSICTNEERGQTCDDACNVGNELGEPPLTEVDIPESEEKTASDPSAEKPSNKKKVIAISCGVGVLAIILIIIILFATHVICLHEWSDATCTEPQICAICNKTQGEPLGHDWKNATCIMPKTCNRCSETEGGALGHNKGEWSVVKKATLEELGERQRACTVCGEVLEKEKIYYYDLTDLDVALYTSVLDTYNSLKAIHLNPDSFELLDAVSDPDGKRTTIHLSFVGGDKEKHEDYFWKDTFGNEVDNIFGKDNYLGTASGTPEVLDLEKIYYFENSGGYKKTIYSGVKVR